MIEVELRGGREVVARFQALSPKVHLRVAKAMATALARLQAYVKGGKLSGQVLHVRTGALRRSIATNLTEEGDVLTGQVGVFGGPTVPYGRAHEYGFDGTVSVKAHLRTIKQAFGRSIEPREVPVREHSMRLHLAERSFLRSTLAEFREAVLQLFAEAVHEAVHGS